MPADTPTPPDFDDDATRVVGAVGEEATSRVSATLPAALGAETNEPTIVGRYRISERIGRGGMASVYRAHDPSIDRIVAIKFLHAALCEEDEYRTRFLREARAAGMLSHPNIVTVHDVGEIDGRPYMTMELIEGEALSEVMARGPMAVREVLVLGVQLAKALHYAHGKGIVHRDIKPSNIALLPDGRSVKVMDFGIAHLDSTTGAQHTRVGDVLGTPQYMSPEQTKGAKIDGRSDLFSVGIILYQMLAGTPPFQGDSVVALAVKIANEEPVPIEKLRPDLPQAVRRIVERCLAKAPERRFQSGAALADAITAALRDLDAEASSAGRARVVPLRLKWALMMGVIVLAVMAIAGTVINRLQRAALIDQVTDYGASLSRFIAAQSAVAALGDEWEAVEVAVQEMMKTGDFSSITVTDSKGVVRVASRPDLVGQPFTPAAGTSLGTRSGDVKVTRYAAAGERMFGFDAPITFQNKPVGRVDLGIAEQPLTTVARLSLLLMSALVLVTVLAVTLAMYFVANWFARPIKLLRESMTEIGHGRFEHRIREQRQDEYGLLYSEFNQMAQALQEGFVAAPVSHVESAGAQGVAPHSRG
jgi:serine/threonine protein kinase/HAMP domain-containing protein